MARALLKKHTIYLQPWNRSVRGYWLPAGPILTLPDKTPDAALGDGVRTVLSISQRDTPWPPPDEADPLLTEVGAASIAEACRGAGIAEIEDDEGEITLTPERVSGTSLSPVEGHAAILRNPDAATLGAALHTAFRGSRTR